MSQLSRYHFSLDRRRACVKLVKIHPFIQIEFGIKDSPGCAPDLILVSSNEIIPVEIKCLKTNPDNNKSYRRAKQLATSQILNTLDIIGQGTRGLIIFMYIYEEYGQIKYDTKYTFIYR